MVAGPDGGVPVKESSPRSMATLLTSVETPLGGESCASPEEDPDAEVLSCESLTGRVPGMPGVAIRDATTRLSGAAEAVKGWHPAGEQAGSVVALTCANFDARFRECACGSRAGSL